MGKQRTASQRLTAWQWRQCPASSSPRKRLREICWAREVRVPGLRIPLRALGPRKRGGPLCARMGHSPLVRYQTRSPTHPLGVRQRTQVIFRSSLNEEFRLVRTPRISDAGRSSSALEAVVRPRPESGPAGTAEAVLSVQRRPVLVRGKWDNAGSPEKHLRGRSMFRQNIDNAHRAVERRLHDLLVELHRHIHAPV